MAKTTKSKREVTIKAADRKPIVAQMRGSIEFGEALQKIADFDGLSVSAMIDRAVREHARSIGFIDPIPKR